MNYLKNKHYLLKYIIVGPIILSLIIPIIVVDIWIEIYHRICFPLCNILFVKRRSYIKIDRHKLKYLSFFQKIGCAYCGYGNGLIAYWREIAGQTEKYWCGIMHEKSTNFNSQEHQERLDFSKYGDKNDFTKKYH